MTALGPSKESLAHVPEGLDQLPAGPVALGLAGQLLLGGWVEDPSLTTAILVILTLVALELGLSVLQFRIPLIDRLVAGLPTLLVDNGRVLHDRLRKLRVDESAIMEAARELQGLERMDQVKYAVLERTITIVPANPG